MQKMENLYDSQSEESIDPGLDESVQITEGFPTTPDILRHVPHHLSVHDTQNNLGSPSPNHGVEHSILNEGILAAASLEQYNCMPLESKSSSPPYYYESLWPPYNTEEPDNGFIEYSERPLYISGRNRFSCVQCSDENSRTNCKYDHNKNVYRGTKKHKNYNVLFNQNVFFPWICSLISFSYKGSF
jgi:hypothetical protein